MAFRASKTSRSSRGSRTPRPWRWLAACLAIIAALYAGVVFGGQHTPKLGLDLKGGTTAILTPQLQGSNKSVSRETLVEATNIIRDRVNGLGISEAQVQPEGNNIRVDVPEASRDQVISLVGTTAQLRFRQVVYAAPVQAPQPTPSSSVSGSPAPSGSAKPSPSGTASVKPSTPTSAPAKIAPKPSASTTAHGRALSEALTGHPLAAAAKPTSTPAASASAKAASAKAASATPTPTPTGSAAAGAGKCPSIVTNAQDTSCLTAAIQQKFTALNCSDPRSPDRTGTGKVDDPNQTVVACGKDGQEKYVLAPAYLVGKDVSGASALNDATQGWEVNLSFTGSGTKKFGDITTKVTSLPPPLNQVAVVLDGVVQVAPRIDSAILGGSAQIYGSFTQAEVNDLAAVLKYGALPIALKVQTVEAISPTLGNDQLHAGLEAGGIGLALVLVYSLLYYRGLGLVSIASLLVSGATTYASVTLLGQQIGYRLSLAGIAGFIVAVGITADSFVVFFERLRDEVREGRSLRSGVERAWVRARRTIISADTVSLLAAVILYWLSVGNVRGFAFTLGLSTLTDLFVVFVFTKPLITVLARTRLYGGSGSFSGLGATRATRSAAAPALTARTATKEV